MRITNKNFNFDKIETAEFTNQLLKKMARSRKQPDNLPIKRTFFSGANLRKILVYVLISITLLFLTFSSDLVFDIALVVPGIALLILLFDGGNDYIPSKLKTYLSIPVWFGIINMILLYVTMNVYNKIATDVAQQIVFEIDYFKEENGTFPNDLDLIIEDLELNLAERYFANKIDYKAFKTGYRLWARMIFGKIHKFNTYNNTWE